jgi:hypothetical protein
LLKKHGFAPSRVVTDRLRSYPAAFRAIGLTAEHDRGLRANNRAENSHQPIRRRERKLQRFKSPGSVQRFLAIHAATFNAFTHQRHLLRRPHFKELRAGSFRTSSCFAHLPNPFAETACNREHTAIHRLTLLVIGIFILMYLGLGYVRLASV